MKYMTIKALALMTSLLAIGCATQKSSDPTAPTGAPDATVTFMGGQANYYASGGGGEGQINYKGVKRNFMAVSAGVGGSGAQQFKATGEVYHLKSLADFQGTYTAAKSGFTIFKGTIHERLENDKGVVIYVEGKTTGLASSTGVSKVTITLK